MSDPKETVHTVPSESAAEVQLHAELSKELVEEPNPAPQEKNIVVVASNPKQMQVAQANLISWAEGKATQVRERLKEVQENLTIAVKNKWRTATLKRVASDLTKEIEFHDKVETALRNGYVIIPNFEDIDVFAIRTTRKRPKPTTVSNTDWGRSAVPMPREQESNRPAVGEGRYVDADSKNRIQRWEKTDKNNTTTKMVSATPSEFRNVDFPFQLAKPQILEKTAEAMKLLVFDDIGIIPGRRKARRRGDPMVIGRVWTKKGNTQRTVSFLITWFVDTKDL